VVPPASRSLGVPSPDAGPPIQPSPRSGLSVYFLQRARDAYGSTFAFNLTCLVSSTLLARGAPPTARAENTSLVTGLFERLFAFLVNCSCTPRDCVVRSDVQWAKHSPLCAGGRSKLCPCVLTPAFSSMSSTAATPPSNETLPARPRARRLKSFPRSPRPLFGYWIDRASGELTTALTFRFMLDDLTKEAAPAPLLALAQKAIADEGRHVDLCLRMGATRRRGEARSGKARRHRASFFDGASARDDRCSAPFSVLFQRERGGAHPSGLPRTAHPRECASASTSCT